MTICHFSFQNLGQKKPTKRDLFLVGGSDEHLRIGECVWPPLIPWETPNPWFVRLLEYLSSPIKTYIVMSGSSLFIKVRKNYQQLTPSGRFRVTGATIVIYELTTKSKQLDLEK